MHITKQHFTTEDAEDTEENQSSAFPCITRRVSVLCLLNF